MANFPELSQQSTPAPEGQPVPPTVETPIQSPTPEAAPVTTEPRVESAPIPETPRVEAPSAPESPSQDKGLGGLRQMLGRTKNPPPAIPIVKDEMMLRVEKIMEEDLADAFTSLPTVKKQEFKIKGEQTAIQIRELLNKTHVKIKKIFKLILAWLLILPGINKFYLEQEAKIKADKILALKQMSDGSKK